MYFQMILTNDSEEIFHFLYTDDFISFLCEVVCPFSISFLFVFRLQVFTLGVSSLRGTIGKERTKVTVKHICALLYAKRTYRNQFYS